MKFVALTEVQTTSLRELQKNGKNHRERQRAHAVLLNGRGYALEQLADIFECDRDTVSSWLELWRKGGVDALQDAPRSGRPGKLDAAAQRLILQAVDSPTPHFKAVVSELLEKKG
jgi:transposase